MDPEGEVPEIKNNLSVVTGQQGIGKFFEVLASGCRSRCGFDSGGDFARHRSRLGTEVGDKADRDFYNDDGEDWT